MFTVNCKYLPNLSEAFACKKFENRCVKTLKSKKYEDLGKTLLTSAKNENNDEIQMNMTYPSRCQQTTNK